MSISSLKWLRQSGFFTPDRTVRYGLLLGGFAACFFLGFIYQFCVWLAESSPAPIFTGLYHTVVLFGYMLLWRAISQFFRKRSLSPIGVLWSILLVGLLFLALGALSWNIGPPEVPGFDGTELTLASVIRMHVLIPLEVLFFFFVLARLRQLTLYKRTKRSERNWFFMLGLMVMASLSAVILSPDDHIGLFQALFIAPAVIFMVVNAFRLSWIIFLSFREKMLCMGLSLALILLLALGSGAGTEGFLPGAAAYMEFYSYPLRIFVMLTTIFGIIYGTTALLSLLFHLPTTSDFQRKADEMAAMHGLTHLVEQAFDRDKLASSIAAAPVEAGSAQVTWLALAQPEDELQPRIAATHRIDQGTAEVLVDMPALFRDVDRMRAPLLIDEAPADHRVHAQPGDGLESLLCVPLIARDRLLGVLFAVREVTHGFEQDDIEAISGFAAQAALALDHARLFEEQLEKERLARELAIAREVQQKLLPSTLPSVSGTTLCASSIAAQEVGGDYYDFLKLDDQRLAFIVADVSGKGTSAAFYMAEMQGIFRSASRLAPAPIDFLCHANEALNGALERSAFISVIYGVLDLEQEELRLARAGHCPAAAINLHGEARYLRPRGMGLGLDRGPLFRKSLSEERVSLHPGDVFVLYTDGVVESRNGEDEEFGYERLLQALREHRHEDAVPLHDNLLDDLQDFTGDEDFIDDMTLVVLKWHGISLSSDGEESQEQTQALPVVDSGAHA